MERRQANGAKDSRCLAFKDFGLCARVSAYSTASSDSLADQGSSSAREMILLAGEWNLLAGESILPGGEMGASRGPHDSSREQGFILGPRVVGICGRDSPAHAQDARISPASLFVSRFDRSGRQIERLSRVPSPKNAPVI